MGLRLKARHRPEQAAKITPVSHQDDSQRDSLRFLRRRNGKNIPKAIARAKND